MRRVLKIALATAALGMGMAAPAGASTVVVGNVPLAGTSDSCDTVPTADTTPASTQCVGYFDGNILDNGLGDPAKISDALALLGITYTGDISNYIGGAVTGDLSTFLGSAGGFTGVQVIGIHWGGGSDQDDSTVGNVTGFYKIDFGSTPTTLGVNLRGISNAYLFTSTSVPEPATWALMLLGFGGIGMALRRNRRKQGLMQIA
jgi:hypothetical protein